MRPDIGRVITERPRTGGGYKYRKGEKKEYDKIPLDEKPKGEKIGQKWVMHYQDGKRFTDVLGPLKGYLNSQIGKPWNFIYSEICKVLPAKGGVSLSHARDHLFQFVALDVILVDKVPCYRQPQKYYSFMRKGDKPWPIHEEFFVHPDSKVLLRNKHLRSYKYRGPKKPPGKGVAKDEWHRYIQNEDGIWFEVTLADMPANKPIYDVWLGRGTTYTLYGRWWAGSGEFYREYGNSHKYAVAKRQLNHREIKRLKLNG